MVEGYHRGATVCFIWDFLEIMSLDAFGTLPQRSCATSWKRTTETFWCRTIEASLNVSFETNLRHCRGIITYSSQVVTAFLNDVVETCIRDILATFDRGATECFI